VPVKPPFELQACWPPELRLVAAAGVRRFDAVARARCESLVAGAFDWERLYKTASAHGLIPLLAANLSEFSALPPAFAEALHADLEENIRFNLGLTAELARVSAALRCASIPALSYKGPTLAQRLYGNVGLRCFSDLDLLVEPADHHRAAEVLIAAGYHRFRQIPDRARQAAGECEEEFAGPDARHVVDLHWAVAQPYFSVGPLPAGWKARLRHLTLAGEQLATFGEADDLLVLALHGGKHRWERMAWLADFAAAIDAGGFDWEAVLLAADEMRIRYHFLLAVTLAHFAFAADVPEKILSIAERAGTPWRQATEVIRSYASGDPVSLLSRWSYSLRMREAWSDRAHAALRFLTRPGPLELQDSPLSPGRAFLYPALRAGRVAGRAWKAAVGAGRTGPR
jgi:hypothetical protein